MAHTRITTKRLQDKAYIISLHTGHYVKIVTSQGCGTYLYIDGKEFAHSRKDGSVEGLQNKQINEILEPLYQEAIANSINKYGKANF